MTESAPKTHKPSSAESATRPLLDQVPATSSPSLVGYILHMQGMIGNRAIQRGILEKINEKFGDKPFVGKLVKLAQKKQEPPTELPEVDSSTMTSSGGNIGTTTHQPLGSGEVDLPGEEGGVNTSNAKSLAYDKPLKQKDLLKEYQEQERDQPHETGIGPKQTWNRNAPNAAVKYLQTEEEREAYELLFEASKQLFVWKEQVIDTTTMQPAFTQGQFDKSKGRVIFVMTESGKIYVADEGKETRTQKILVDHQEVTIYLSLFNHSSLVGGSPVTAAGEMFFTNGKLTRITDFSGHYQPGIEHTMQVLAVLEKGGLQGLDKIEVEFFVADGQTYTARQLLDMKKTADWRHFRNTLEMKAFQTNWDKRKFEDAHARIKSIFQGLDEAQKKEILRLYYQRAKYGGYEPEKELFKGFFNDLGMSYEAYDRQREEELSKASAERMAQPTPTQPSTQASTPGSTQTTTETKSDKRELDDGYHNS